MDVTCDCSYSDAGNWELFDRNLFTARKEYKCCECGENIRIGKKYEHIRGKEEGVWYSFKTCMRCVKVAEKYCPNGRLIEGLVDQVQDCHGWNFLTQFNK